MNRDYSDYFLDIITAIEKTQEFVKGLTFDDFRKDDKTIHISRFAFHDSRLTLHASLFTKKDGASHGR